MRGILAQVEIELAPWSTVLVYCIYLWFISRRCQ
jgi:hypothetical protein